MKKLLIFLSLLLVFLTSNSAANTTGNIHEYTVDLYYANGVKASSRKKGYENWKIYTKRFKKNSPSLKQALKYGEAKLAYNASYLWGVSDFFEVITQFKNEHPGVAITWEALMHFVERKLKFDLGGMIDYLSKITSSVTLAEQVEAYKESVKRGHGVITVAHSQGNFFTNESFKEIVEASDSSWMKSYLHMVSVATPTKEVFDGAPHVTFDNDTIVALMTNLRPTHTNPHRSQFKNALGVCRKTIPKRSQLSCKY